MKNQAIYHSKSLEEHEKILGISGNYTPESVLKAFQSSYEVYQENEKLDQIKPVLEAKNKIMQNLISSQMKAQRYFEFESPFKDSCVACRGTGEIYKFNKKTVKVNCHICAGKKKLKIECPICEGSGRFIKKLKGGKEVNVKCRKCKGTGRVYVVCIECLGKGKRKKMVLSHVIKSTTPCKKCKQLGFTSSHKPIPSKRYKPQKLNNPVINQTLADKIKKAIQPTD
ncbi:MAG: hypothetical protein K9L62_10960 [Vallitaleaceae bacterium]|nr:hypothetical protein [Vallitaleaceae bacterium]